VRTICPRSSAAHHGAHDGDHHHDLDSADGHRQHTATPNVPLFADLVLHAHWHFFGLDFSMPVPELPADENADIACPMAIVRPSEAVALTPQAGPLFDGVHLAAQGTLSAGVAEIPAPLPRQPNLVASLLLCDSARLERSGVLRA